MNNTNPTPEELFENPGAWLARFGLAAQEVAPHDGCPICSADLGVRIAA